MVCFIIDIFYDSVIIDWIGEHDTAVMEMAEASGITLVEGKPDPWKATSLGVGCAHDRFSEDALRMFRAAVSYTHLDVYKRQDKDTSRARYQWHME